MGDRWRAIGWYVRERRGRWGLWALCVAVFAVTFALYGVPLAVVAYPALLCAGIGLVATGLGLWRHLRRHRQALRALRGLDVAALPPGRTLAEEDARQLLLALQAQQTAHQTEQQRRAQAHLDYYTTWVHQIKTPIAVMRMMLQGEDTEEHRALAVELFRIEQYAEMALSYQRLDSDQTDYVFQEQPLDPLIRGAVHKFAPQFVRRRIRLVWAPTGMRVLTDGKWLQFIIEQLLSNAIKYTPGGEIRITAAEGVLSIADTGIGIAPEDLPRIFDRGFTGYNGRVEQSATGLGLYLCRQAAQRLSIGLSASSVPGEGSVFRLDLNTTPRVYE